LVNSFIASAYVAQLGTGWVLSSLFDIGSLIGVPHAYRFYVTRNWLQNH
jgi:hypothetical protein